MSTNFLTTADFLQGELRAFYDVLRQEHDPERVKTAIARLRAAVEGVQGLTDGPGENWQTLVLEQRWGYMRVLSHLGTAGHELQRARHRFLQGPEEH